MVETTKNGQKRLVIWKFPGNKPVKIIKPLHPAMADFVENIEKLSENVWKDEKKNRKKKSSDREKLRFLDNVYNSVVDAIAEQSIKEMKKIQKEILSNERRSKRKFKRTKAGKSFGS